MDNPAKRKCDKCGREYTMNAKEIPRIILVKRIDIDDIHSKEVFIKPDFCASCMHNIVNVFGNRILFKLRNLWGYFK